MSKQANKLTVLERRAKARCEQLAENDGGVFVIEWRASRTWGRVAVITDNYGEKAAEASGCGYCKQSGVLAVFLRFLVPEVAAAHGCGLYTVKETMAAHGWLLEVSEGRTEDHCRLSRVAR